MRDVTSSWLLVFEELKSKSNGFYKLRLTAYPKEGWGAWLRRKTPAPPAAAYITTTAFTGVSPAPAHPARSARTKPTALPPRLPGSAEQAQRVWFQRR